VLAGLNNQKQRRKGRSSRTSGLSASNASAGIQGCPFVSIASRAGAPSHFRCRCGERSPSEAEELHTESAKTDRDETTATTPTRKPVLMYGRSFLYRLSSPLSFEPLFELAYRRKDGIAAVNKSWRGHIVHDVPFTRVAVFVDTALRDVTCLAHLTALLSLLIVLVAVLLGVLLKSVDKDQVLAVPYGRLHPELSG